jgi:hypothetical protein
LHADFDCFEGAEEDVGDEFCGGGGAEVDDCLGRVGEELLAVVVFETFVGAVFACALEGVADEGWGLESERGVSEGFVSGGSLVFRTHPKKMPRTPSLAMMLRHAEKFDL